MIVRLPLVLEWTERRLVWLEVDTEDTDVSRPQEVADGIAGSADWYEWLDGAEELPGGGLDRAYVPNIAEDDEYEIFPRLDEHVYEHRRATGYYAQEKGLKPKPKRVVDAPPPDQAD